MNVSMEMIVMELVVNAGNARSLAMEGITKAKKGDFAAANKNIEEANTALEKAHSFQTDLIQSESRGEKVELSLLMVHAQDHLMNAMTVRDLSREFIDLYEEIKKERG